MQNELNTVIALTLPAAVEEHIKAFAKAKKISAAGIAQLTREVVSMLPASAKPVQRTRKALDKNVEFREQVLQRLPELKGNRYTFRQLAEMFNMDAPNATNNLVWLRQHGKVAWVDAGKAECPVGQRGPKPSMIAFV